MSGGARRASFAGSAFPQAVVRVPRGSHQLSHLINPGACITLSRCDVLSWERNLERLRISNPMECLRSDFYETSVGRYCQRSIARLFLFVARPRECIPPESAIYNDYVIRFLFAGVYCVQLATLLKPIF